MLIYIAGPYTADTPEKIHQNITNALDMAAKVWQAGHVAIFPHGNTYHFEQRDIGLTNEDYINGDLDILRRCDAILMLEGWQTSKGAVKEHYKACQLNMPIYFGKVPEDEV